MRIIWAWCDGHLGITWAPPEPDLGIICASAGHPLSISRASFGHHLGLVQGSFGGAVYRYRSTAVWPHLFPWIHGGTYLLDFFMLHGHFSKIIKTRLGEHPPRFSHDQSDRTDIENTWGTLPGPKDHDFFYDFDDFLKHWEGSPPLRIQISVGGYPPGGPKKKSKGLNKKRALICFGSLYIFLGPLVPIGFWVFISFCLGPSAHDRP